MRSRDRWSRREWLAACGAASAAGLAGCASGGGGDDAEEAGTNDTDQSADEEPDVEQRWSSDQWQLKGVDAGNTAHSPDGEAPSQPIAERWAFTPEIETQQASLNTQPLIHDGSVYVAAYDGRVWALDLASGDELWHRTLEPDKLYSGIRTSMAVDDDHLYVPANDSLYALSAETGETVWSDTREARVGNLTLYGQRLIAPVLFTPAEPRIVQWAVEDGTPEEIHRFDDKSVSDGVAVADGTIVIHAESSVYAIGLETGDVEWDYAVNRAMHHHDPVTDGERVYAASGSIEDDAETVVSAMNLATGEHLWRYDPDLHIDDAPATFDDVLLLQADESLRIVQGQTGEEIWTFEQPGHGTPAVVGDLAYVNAAVTIESPLAGEGDTGGSNELHPVDGIAAIDLQEETIDWERGTLPADDTWGDDYVSMLTPSPVVAQGVALFTQYRRGIVAYEAADDGSTES